LFDVSQGAAWKLAPKKLWLGENIVHVWRAWLEIDPTSQERLSMYLPAEEKARAARFVFAKDRNHHIVARAILRQLLGCYLRQPPASICIKAGPQGKPALGLVAGLPPLRFNLSHSYGLALYAFALHREVGIDVEKIRPDVANEGLAERYFSAEERKELQTIPKELRSKAFYLCWTRKEAYIKARGAGLQIPLDSFGVSLAPDKPATLSSADQDQWSLFSVRPDTGFAGALVIEGCGSRIQFWEWHDLDPRGTGNCYSKHNHGHSRNFPETEQ
jgi:4'-phosphopantetheinyl transferase